MTIRALLVDDEAPARAKLRRLLAAEADFAVAGEAADGEAAVAAIRRLRPDVVFLDVQMPRGSGFDVVEAVGEEAMPRVVFVTAHDEHALRAFEVAALDYLLKPYAPSRFRQVLERVRRAVAEAAPTLPEGLAELLAAARGPRPVVRLLARRGPEREVFVAVDDIDRVRADGNYVRLHTAKGELIRRDTLAAIEARLGDGFLRINRSEVVRYEAIAEVQPWFHGDHRVILHDGTTLSWSRRYRKRWDGEDDDG